MRWSEDDLRACNLGRFCIEEIPFRIENFFDRDIQLDESDVLELASELMNVCLDYEAMDSCIYGYLKRKTLVT